MILYFGFVSSEFHGTGHYIMIRTSCMSDALRLGRKYTRFMNQRETSRPAPASMRDFGGPYADWTLESLRRVPRRLRGLPLRDLDLDEQSTLYDQSTVVWDDLRDGCTPWTTG